ncbi:biofilm regulation diguanylate cyclase SiaD [Noviherbaspirillum saxi]|uniref:diguanylate cyclase n=1 Tax=Noviherbaspirillum saxi TaxID=2320863 RepID=A0A3A3FUX5_9BURK|nr:biofilm regulation diguanylate cyclase SiaD [Noviherbaspirillum saxi]RJF99876.1 GGDEF domain-containing protein [Noviherbaspirillum saxi]
MRDDKHVAPRIEELLADPAHSENPLRIPLDDLYAEFRSLLHQIDRVTRISDRYQSVSQEEKISLTDRYRKQLRQLEKIARISDRYQSMMRDLNEALKDASTRDALTGIGNRRMLMDRVKAEAARMERMSRPMTVALLDVDRFKAVNDAHGHEAGDRALIEIAQVIQSSVRDYDICGRWGGEEFMVIMPEVGAADAAMVIERVRSTIAGLDLRVGDTQLVLSASFGIAERRAGENASDTINRADAALFEAKRAGRNRAQVAI